MISRQQRPTRCWSSRAVCSTASQLSAGEVEKIADLESREVLLSKLAGAFKALPSRAVGLFQAPLSQMARLARATRGDQTGRSRSSCTRCRGPGRGSHRRRSRRGQPRPKHLPPKRVAEVAGPTKHLKTPAEPAE